MAVFAREHGKFPWRPVGRFHDGERSQREERGGEDKQGNSKHRTSGHKKRKKAQKIRTESWFGFVFFVLFVASSLLRHAPPRSTPRQPRLLLAERGTRLGGERRRHGA